MAQPRHAFVVVIVILTITLMVVLLYSLWQSLREENPADQYLEAIPPAYVVSGTPDMRMVEIPPNVTEALDANNLDYWKIVEIASRCHRMPKSS